MKPGCPYCEAGSCPFHGEKPAQQNLKSFDEPNAAQQSLLDWVQSPSPVQHLPVPPPDLDPTPASKPAKPDENPVAPTTHMECAPPPCAEESEKPEAVSLVRQPMKQPKFATKIPLQVTIPMDDLVTAICALNRDELLQLVKWIDASTADWDFTLKLCRHFARLRKQYDAEVKKDEFEEKAKKEADAGNQ